MVNLALKDFPKLKVCDDEINLSKPNYTINTLFNLKNKFPKSKIPKIPEMQNSKIPKIQKKSSESQKSKTSKSPKF